MVAEGTVLRCTAPGSRNVIPAGWGVLARFSRPWIRVYNGPRRGGLIQSDQHSGSSRERQRRYDGPWEVRARAIILGNGEIRRKGIEVVSPHGSNSVVLSWRCHSSGASAPFAGQPTSCWRIRPVSSEPHGVTPAFRIVGNVGDNRES